jgi:hypothetical protein
MQWGGGASSRIKTLTSCLSLTCFLLTLGPLPFPNLPHTTMKTTPIYREERGDRCAHAHQPTPQTKAIYKTRDQKMEERKRQDKEGGDGVGMMAATLL